MTTDSESSANDVRAPLSVTEQAIASLWDEVLQTSGPRQPSDNFFALGGDSMSMVTVLFRIKEEFSVDLPPEALFNAPSLRQLSALVDSSC
jgi:acyl carrier protein